jgi:predicted enzyme related to lactoylglutathione lyase
MTLPLGKLRFLYMGSAKFDEDVTFYEKVIGATLLWNREAFGARVAAFRTLDGPDVLLADHRPAPSCLPVCEVDNLTATVRALKARGWKAKGSRFEIPNGPCYLFEDPSGNEFAIFEDVRPGVMGG